MGPSSISRRAAALGVGALFAGVLVSFLVFTQQQADEMRRDAEVIANLYALSVAASDARSLEERDEIWWDAAAELLGEISRLQIPVVITDTLGNPQNWSFLPDDIAQNPDGTENLEAIRAYAAALDEERAHFDIEGSQIHFGEPQTLQRLGWIPYLQIGSLIVVVGGGAWLILTSFRSERERIWSAMARESAHQMGTPLSSLVGWLEVLETKQPPESEVPGEPDLIDEMAADVRRLQKVSRRFELIGRKTKLEPVSIAVTVEQLRRYFEARLPSLSAAGKIDIDVKIEPAAPKVLGNATLLEWAFENLIKNAMDALSPDGGRIVISHLGPNGRRSVFRVRDTGPGVPAQIRDKVFDIGVTTKERGWGVGLSLTRRIIEDMHDGAIHLEDKPGGASFRLELPRVRERRRA
ncbi:MAG: ATP-binding protein [Gemmatimonadetes bacterium]|nr:ATP-binding protein [Gemmatimonadota bacterium]